MTELWQNNRQEMAAVHSELDLAPFHRVLAAEQCAGMLMELDYNCRAFSRSWCQLELHTAADQGKPIALAAMVRSNRQLWTGSDNKEHSVAAGAALRVHAPNGTWEDYVQVEGGQFPSRVAAAAITACINTSQSSNPTEQQTVLDWVGANQEKFNAQIRKVFYGPAMMQFAAKGCTAELQEIISRDSTAVECKAADGSTPLYCAAFHCHEQAVKVLVAAGAVVDQRDVDGFTPLGMAAFNGGEKVVEALLDAGAGVDNVAHEGGTPLAAAAQQGHAGCLQMLLRKKAMVDRVDKEGTTALMIACTTGHLATAQLLVDAGADVRKKDEDGCTPLCIAAKHGHTAVIESLIKSRASIDQQDRFKCTPLFMAVRAGHVPVVRLLLRDGISRATYAVGQHIFTCSYIGRQLGAC